ncbi:50S ribosomal protein L32 chloroplastic [Euphorbia peplus]|nr:50S ribosomal protein L32 chloroplastic [Euphorbia peplus]
MAAQTILTASSPSFHPLLLPTHSSSFHHISLNFPRQSLSLTLSSTPNKPFSASAASNEAFYALNCTSDDVSVLQDYDGVEEATIVDSQIFLSDDESDDDCGPVSAVPKKRTSRMKKRIRKNHWKRKGAVAAKKAYSLAKSIYTGKSTSFMTDISKKDP